MKVNNATIELNDTAANFIVEAEATVGTNDISSAPTVARKHRLLTKSLLLAVGICAGALLSKLAILVGEIYSSLNALYAGMPT